MGEVILGLVVVVSIDDAQEGGVQLSVSTGRQLLYEPSHRETCVPTLALKSVGQLW